LHAHQEFTTNISFTKITVK